MDGINYDLEIEKHSPSYIDDLDEVPEKVLDDEYDYQDKE